jgi:hypothetical protein
MGNEGQSRRFPYRTFVWNSDRWDGFELRDDDIVISTAPKCGTTWMQMQCALLLFRSPNLPAPLARLSPWLDMNTRPLEEVRAELAAQTHRRFIKTHLPLAALPWSDQVTYVHVARDPRDVALSWDNHLSNMNFDKFVEARAEAVGLDDLAELGPPPETPEDPVDRFWQWVEGDDATDEMSGLQRLVHHSRAFWERRDEPNVHLFHYGDQRADLRREMTRLAEALGVEPPTTDLVDAAQFENMKARSAELVPNSDRSFWQSADRFFHKARSGDWRELIGEDGVPRYEAAVRAASDDDALIAWLHDGGLADSPR